MRFRRTIGWVGGVVVFSAVAPAAADSVEGTRSGERLYETKHEVTATLHRGYAELRVRRTVKNEGGRHDQAIFMIDTPQYSVAVGLRTLGAVRGRPQWFAGELMEAEAAAAKYKELTGFGAFYPKDPALLSWRNQNLLALQVFPVAPNDEKTIEYTLLLPTKYSDGAHRVDFPGLGTERMPAELTFKNAKKEDALLLDGRPVKAGVKARPLMGKSVEIALVPKVREPIGGELAVAQASDTRFVTRFAVQAAPRVAEVPKRAAIVVAIDASRSLASSVIEAQTKAAAGYLAHFADAEVEVVTFDREVRPRYGRLVPAARAKSDLVALPITQKNGSDVDRALAEAEAILAKLPADRPKRIVLLTDARSRSSLKPDRLRAAVGKSGAIVHIGVIHEGSPQVMRDDEHVWASAARATGGLVWQAYAAPGAGPAAHSHAYEEWARPIRIDRFKLFSPDVAIGERERPPEKLDEGEGFEDAFIGSRAAAWVRVEGELWSRPVSYVVHADAVAEKRWAALVFGSDLYNQLSEPEMLKLAMTGGAVSPVTSYLAIEPGVRPSTEGLTDAESGSGMGFGSGRGTLRMGATSTRGRAPPLDRDAWLRSELAREWLSCGGPPNTATVSLETTKAEVVDVTRVDIGKSDPILERCLSEATWDLVLPVQFEDEWNVYSVSI